MRTDERGSLVIAMAVVVVLSGLSMAALARTVSAIGSARVAQDAAAASAAADAGMADAVFALDHGAVPDRGRFPAAIGPATGAVGAARYQWTATATDARTVAIRSVGTANGRQHQLDATATRAPRWPWVIATAGSFVLDGPAEIGEASRIAAGGPMTMRDGSVGGAARDLIGPGAACAGCASPNVLTIPVTFPTASIPTSPAPLPCPASPIRALPTGTYVCSGDITFDRDVDLSGPMAIYQQNGAGGLGAPTAIHFGGSMLNTGGTVANLSVHKIGPGLVDPGEGLVAGQFTGILDAPQATLHSSSCHFALTGAMVLGSFACTSSLGEPTLTYGAGSILVPTWTLGGYHDAPVGSA